MLITEANIENSKEISNLIKQTVLFANTKIYPKEKIDNVLTMYKPSKIEGYMKEGKYYIALEDNIIVGCVLVIKDEMSSLYVLPKYMNRGIGTRLLEKAEEYIRECKYKHVWIWATLNAVDFYKSKGYVQESDITDKEGNTWYIGMKKILF